MCVREPERERNGRGDVKEIQLQIIVDPAASHIQGDDARLQQVIWNLLSNAVKFTPKGG